MIRTFNQQKTFVDAFHRRAQATPDASLYRMLGDDGADAGVLTFGELDRRARALGAYFQKRNAAGERALLLYPAGLDYITAFYGCLYGGVIAVPAYPPRMNRNLSRLISIVADSSPTYVLTESEMLTNIQGALSNQTSLRSAKWIATNVSDFSGASDWKPQNDHSDAVAFLQYTSGSTSDPKGVMVTHANLARNEELIRRAFAVDEETVIVSWLPIYHDMGLIGNVLAAGWNGAACHLMSPAAFLRRPAMWLEAISRLRATASGGPNFAYDLCVQKIRPEDCVHLDLSSWRVAFNGAEPVRAATLQRFAGNFRRFGFREEAFFPCYGMAETTLLVSGGSRSETPVIEKFETSALSRNRAVACNGGRPGDLHVSSGRAHVERIAIVDPATRIECEENAVGEIWVADEAVAQGYWNAPKKTAETFGAHIAGTGEGPFLRTGDLGLLRRGELFVMGRLKDVIIVRGRNHYPQDIELAAESSHPALHGGCTVALAVESAGEEKVIIVAEVVRERRMNAVIDEIGQAVHRAVANEHGLSVAELVLIQPASSLKTSSGKIQRSATRKAYLENKLEVLRVWRNSARELTELPPAPVRRSVPATNLESWLTAEFCKKLKIPSARFDRDRSIAEYGIDSLAGAELVSSIEEKLGIALSFEDLFVGEPSLTRIIEMIQEQLMHHSATDSPVEAIVMPSAAYQFQQMETRL